MSRRLPVHGPPEPKSWTLVAGQPGAWIFAHPTRSTLGVAFTTSPNVVPSGGLRYFEPGEMRNLARMFDHWCDVVDPPRHARITRVGQRPPRAPAQPTLFAAAEA